MTRFAPASNTTSLAHYVSLSTLSVILFSVCIVRMFLVCVSYRSMKRQWNEEGLEKQNRISIETECLFGQEDVLHRGVNKREGKCPYFAHFLTSSPQADDLPWIRMIHTLAVLCIIVCTQVFESLSRQCICLDSCLLPLARACYLSFEFHFFQLS